MIFRVGDKGYNSASTLEVVRALQREEAGTDSESLPLREFLLLSLSRLGDRVPARELEVSPRLGDETVALGYLYLRDEYGSGELLDVPNRKRWAHEVAP